MNKSFIIKKIKEYLEKEQTNSKFGKIHYWTDPNTGECHPSIIIDGKKARLRAGILIIKDNNQILLGEEEGEPGVFSLPGGAINKNEQPIDAATREAREEVNIIVDNVRETDCDYCVKHKEVLPWVKENIPEEEWWYHYYTCLCIGDFVDYYDGNVNDTDKDPVMLKTSKFYKIEDVINEPSFKPEWKKALIKFGYIQQEKIEEKIEINDKLNDKIWNENNELLPEVRDKIQDIVDEFKHQLEENGVKLIIKDIYIVGSNANYNYNDQSDLDIHIIADESFDCDENHLQIIYNVYKTLFNDRYDITINGINVELYVENENNITNVSTGVYSLKKGWLREPSQYMIPEIDEEKLEKAVADWEQKYLQILKNPSIDKIDNFIDKLYELRANSMIKEGEFGFGNLLFKEIRYLKYLENLKELRRKLKNNELSLK